MSARVSAAAAIVGLAVSLAGCSSGGFRPLYAGGAGGPVAAGLAAVEITALDGRVGQVVRNELIFFFTGGGKAAPPRYILDMTVVEGGEAPIVDPFSGRPEIVSLTLTATFALRPAGVGPSAAPLFRGNVFGRASYTATLQRFANIRAQRDAEDRAAKVLAEQVRTQVASYLATAARS